VSLYTLMEIAWERAGPLAVVDGRLLTATTATTVRTRICDTTPELSLQPIMSTDVSAAQTAALHRAARRRRWTLAKSEDTAISVSSIVVVHDDGKRARHCNILTADGCC
jgi:hypothetical protein